LPVLVLCGLKLSYIIREEQKLKLLEYREMCKISEYKKKEVAGSLKKLHNEINDFYSLQTVVRVIQSRTGFRGYCWGNLKKRVQLNDVV